jgi:hypothetical protein
MEEDRRKSSRVKKNLTAQYACGDRNSLKWEMSQVNDISETGVAIGTAETFAAGAIVYIRLKLPSKPFEWLEIEGEVIDSKNFVTRIKFTQLKDTDKEFIKEYIAWFMASRPANKLLWRDNTENK